MSIRIGLYQHRFRQWLEQQDPTALVGQRGDCYKCVLATFLRSQGAPEPFVWRNNFSLNEGTAPFRPLPPWAKTFVSLIDKSDDYDHSAALAKATLARVERLLP